MATPTQMTEASKKDDNMTLSKIPCIHYPLCFQKDNQKKVQALINSGSDVNTMTPAYALKLGLQVRQTDVGA